MWRKGGRNLKWQGLEKMRNDWEGKQRWDVHSEIEKKRWRNGVRTGSSVRSINGWCEIKGGKWREDPQWDEGRCLCFTQLHKTITNRAPLSPSIYLETKQKRGGGRKGGRRAGKRVREACESLKKKSSPTQVRVQRNRKPKFSLCQLLITSGNSSETSQNMKHLPFDCSERSEGSLVLSTHICPVNMVRCRTTVIDPRFKGLLHLDDLILAELSRCRRSVVTSLPVYTRHWRLLRQQITLLLDSVIVMNRVIKCLLLVINIFVFCFCSYYPAESGIFRTNIWIPEVCHFSCSANCWFFLSFVSKGKYKQNTSTIKNEEKNDLN